MRQFAQILHLLQMEKKSCILIFGILGLSTYAVGTLPDYVSEDSNTLVSVHSRDSRDCGNERLDPGEECECGPGIQKSCREDSCCQTNCQFKLLAQCSNHDPCCENCKFKPKGQICKIAASDCGISEYCKGDTSHCSASSYKRNGWNCSGDTGPGICIDGSCRSYDEPCQEQWNDSTENKPLQSPCPRGFICVNRSCLPVKDFVNNLCPKGLNGLECSGQGDCTTAYLCHCHPGWKGHSCSVIDDRNSSTINDERPGIVKGVGPDQGDSTSDTTALVFGLVSFVIIVSIIFIAMAFRYIPSRPPKDESGIYPPLPDENGEGEATRTADNSNKI